MPPFTALSHRWRPLLGLAVAGTVVVLVGLHRGADSNWDLRNYHLYNGRAFITGTFRTDVAVASIQSYLNPLIDTPLAVMVGLFGIHRGILASGIVLQAFGYLALWRLARAFFANRDGLGLPIAAFAVAVTGSAAMSLSYTHFGEWVTAACLCEAFTMMLRVAHDEHDHRTRRRLIAAGLWIGAAIGLKLTSVPFAIALLLSLLVLRPKWRQLLQVAGSVVVGVLATGGFWMIWLTIKYGNPVFPFYNGIFHSPAALPGSFYDSNYRATGISSFLRLPLEMLRGTNHHSERLYPFQDWRIAGALLLGTHAVVMAWQRRHSDTPSRFSRHGTMLATAAIAGTVIWLLQFGIYRYFVFGELLISLTIVHCLITLTRRRVALTVWLSLVIVVVGAGIEHAPNWGRDAVMRIEGLNPGTPGDSTYVVLSGPRPIAYLTSSFAANTHFMTLTSFAEAGATGPATLFLKGPLEQQYHAFLNAAQASGHFFAVIDGKEAVLPSPMDSYTLDNCKAFTAVRRPMLMCSVGFPP